MGTDYFIAGQLAEGRQVLEKVEAIAPRSIRVKNNLAEVYIKMDDLPASEQKYKETLKVEPNFMSHSGLARTYLLQDKPAPAVAEAKKALRLNPRYGMAWFFLGFAYVEMGKRAEQSHDKTTALALYLRAAKNYAAASKFGDKDAAGQLESTMSRIKRLMAELKLK